jgi:hypothetical protein
MEFLNRSGLLVERVLMVLDYMESLQVDLAILLWAVSWNIPELVSHPKVRFTRTSLMLSDELPVILAHWHQPPRTHSAGIRTKAACDTMNKWAVCTVSEAIGEEIQSLIPIMCSPQEELSEELLLSIRWGDLISEVKYLAPTLWSIICYTAHTPKQEIRNKNKEPDTVHCQ